MAMRAPAIQTRQFLLNDNIYEVGAIIVSGACNALGMAIAGVALTMREKWQVCVQVFNRMFDDTCTDLNDSRID